MGIVAVLARSIYFELGRDCGDEMKASELKAKHGLTDEEMSTIKDIVEVFGGQSISVYTEQELLDLEDVRRRNRDVGFAIFWAKKKAMDAYTTVQKIFKAT